MDQTTAHPEKGGFWKSAAVLAGFLFAAYLGIAGSKPPRALPDTAPESEFSAFRAVKHLEAIAAKPHSLGSAAHDEVRDIIMEKWKSLGFDPEIQTVTLVREERSLAANLQNILVRLEGTDGTGPGRALMLATHYDSTESSSGAADAGSGIAAIFETARALKAGPHLKNDVIFLITDGEENGLLGAEAFVREHSWKADVGLVLNFEARGTSGPAWMFETSRGNSRLIKVFAQASPYPRASSLAVSIYRLMPTNTDLTVFMEAGLQGMNFAFIDGPLDYHTSMDNLANLHLGSLQHQGSYALGLARHFGDNGIPGKASEDAVYFNFVGSFFIRYSRMMSFVLAFLSAALLVFAGALGFKKKILRGKNLLLSLLFLITALVLVPALLVLGQKAIRLLHGKWLANGHYQYNVFYLMALAFLAVAVFLSLYLPFRSKAGWPNLAFTAGSIGTLLTCGLVLYFPGASYLTGWPTLLLAGLLGIIFLSKEVERASRGKTALVILACFPTVLLIAPLIYVFFIAMGLSPTGTAGISALLVSLLWMIIPALDLITRSGKKTWPLLAALGFLAFTAAGAMTSTPTARHPLQSEMSYLMDFDAGRAFWLARAESWDRWKAKFLPDPQPGYPITEQMAGDGGWAHQETAVMADAPPAVEIAEESETDGVRTLKLRVLSSRRPQETFVNAPEGRVLSAEVNGKKIFVASPETRNLYFRLINPGPNGFVLSLKAKSGQPLSLVIRERRLGLPEIPGRILPRLPPEIAGLFESTILKKTFNF